jgi:glucose/arabinose dehydrogenase
MNYKKSHIMNLIIAFTFVFSFSESWALTKKVVAKDLEIPWAIEELPNGDLLIAERRGQLKQLNLKTGLKTGKIISLTGVPTVYNSGQGGLLDLALSPGFEKNKYLYFTFSKAVKDKNTTVLARGKLDENKLTAVEEIFQAVPALDSKLHFGSRIAFDGRGHVFVSIGERDERKNAQDLNVHLGKVIRLNEDGTVPKDNPFVGQKDKRPEIWSYGHRNPQGLWFDRTSNQLYESEHGPRGGDEINKIEAGKNYGWPVITHGKEYWGPSIGEKSKSGMQEALKYYVPSIAPSDLIIYSGKIFKDWKGSFISGSLVLTHLNVVSFSGGEVGEEKRFFEKEMERVRSLCETKDGQLYLGVDSGEIWQVIN